MLTEPIQPGLLPSFDNLLPPAAASAGPAWQVMRAILPVVLLFVLASLVLTRSGYSPDEEITAVAARAIAIRGAPILPSGIFYPRGVPFLYLAWLSASLLGSSMAALRVPSLLVAAAGLFPAQRLSASLCGQSLALPLFLASAPPFIAAAVFARSYSGLVASTVLFVWLLAKWMEDRQRVRAPLVALTLASLLHPVGAALAGLPIAIAILERPANRASAIRLAVLSVMAAALSVAIPYGVHFLSLAVTGITATRETGLYALPSLTLPARYVVTLAGYRTWALTAALFAFLAFTTARWTGLATPIVVILFVCGATFELGALIVVCAAGLMLCPQDARRSLSSAVFAGLSSLLWWSFVTSWLSDAQLSRELILGIGRASMSYPIGHLVRVFDAFPALAILACGGAAAAMRDPDTDLKRLVRAVALTFLVLLALFDLVALPVSERYFLLPWTLEAIVAIYGFGQLVWLAKEIAPSTARVARFAVILIAVSWVAVGEISYARGREAISEVRPVEQWLAPATGPSWEPATLKSVTSPGDKLICTEELACMYLIGRVNYLFALPPSDIAHYVGERGGQRLGFYAGTPVVTTVTELEAAGGADGCTVVVALRTGKVGFDEYADIAKRVLKPFAMNVVFSRPDAFVGRMCRDH